MSENFEFMKQHPNFQARLTQLGSAQQAHHVAQQLRRDKLRVQQQQQQLSSSSPNSSSSSPHYSHGLPNPNTHNPNFGKQSQEVQEPRSSTSGFLRTGYPGYPGIGALVPLYDHSMISSDMMTFQTGPDFQTSCLKESTPTPAPTTTTDHSGWKSLTQPNSDYLINYMQNSSTHNPVLGPMVVGSMGGGGGFGNLFNPDVAHQSAVPILGCNPNTTATTNTTTAAADKGYEGHVGFSINPLQTQFLHHRVPPQAEVKIREHSQGLLVPSFGSTIHGTNDQWTSTPRVQAALDFRIQQWSSCHDQDQSMVNDHQHSAGTSHDQGGQGLSLSLSFHHTPELQLQQHYDQSGFREHNDDHDQVSVYGVSDSDERQQAYCSGLKDVVGQLAQPASLLPGGVVQKNPVPLGPFTGYASVLKNSKFLRPAQILLDEVCNVGNVAGCSGTGKMPAGKAQVDHEMDMISGEGSAISSDSHGGARMVINVSPTGISPQLSSGFPSIDSGIGIHENAAASSSSGSIDRNEHRRKKTRLISMLDEVFKRYRHYYRQLQLVVSSFESVPGLSSAAPYTDMAIKTMSKHFRQLKNAINDQLRHTCKVLGEDCFSPGSVTRDHDISRLRLDSQQRGHEGLVSVVAGSGVRALIDPQHHLQQQQQQQQQQVQQQHVWRPQRGLPERAVAVLRAWLFDHFLHPYPTDTDKQMLAKQTGLSRNQVSNWFINARVRLWKPMVEEIHMLETRQSSGSMDLNLKKTDKGSEVDLRNTKESLSRLSSLQEQQVDNLHYGNTTTTFHGSELPLKRSRNEVMPLSPPPNIGDTAGSMSFSQYHPSDVLAEMKHSSREGVSLTLGLHHNAMCLPISQHDQAMHHQFTIQEGGNHHHLHPISNDVHRVGNMNNDVSGCGGGGNATFSLVGYEGKHVVGQQLLHDFVG